MVTTALTVQQKALTLRDELFAKEEQFAKAMPKWMTVDRLLRVVFTTAMSNPKILDCTKESIFGSIMQCAQLGLEPILGRAYLIPYNNSKNIDGKWVKVMECQMQPGYQGLIDLARRSNTISDVYALNVYENDEFDMTFGMSRDIIHRPWFMNSEHRKNGNRGDLIGSYAIWQLKDGTMHPQFMYVDDIYKRRDKSPAYQNALKYPDNKTSKDCPWIQWPEEMAVKTVIKNSSKFVPASIEFMEAVEVDNGAEIGLIPSMPLGGGGGNDFSFDQLGSGPKPEEQFETIIENNNLARDKVNEFAERLANVYGSTREEVISQAVEDEDGFVKEFNKWVAGSQKGSPEDGDEGGSSSSSSSSSKKTIGEEIGGVKTPGLMKWEKENHDDIPHMSPEDKKFFLDKWLRTIKVDYYAEGQPGYEGAPSVKTEGSGTVETEGKDSQGKRLASFQSQMIEYQAGYPEIFHAVLVEKALPSDIREIPEDMFDEVLEAIDKKIA